MGLAAKLTRFPDDAAIEAPAGALAPEVHTAADIFLISREDDFLLELGPVLGDVAALHPLPSLAGALEHGGASRRAHILAVDTRGMTDLRNTVGSAYARAPHALILLFAHAADVERIRCAFSESRVFATLPLPLDPACTARVCAAALRAARAAIKLPHDAVAADPTTPAPPERDRWGIGAGLAVVVLAAGLISQQPRSAMPGAAPVRPALAMQAHARRDARVEQLLEKARTAMAGKRYSEPEGDSALLYYRTAMAAAPGDPDALQGLAQLSAILVERFDAQLRASQLDAAQATLAAFKSAAPADARGAMLAARLHAARSASAHMDAAGADTLASADAPVAQGLPK